MVQIVLRGCWSIKKLYLICTRSAHNNYHRSTPAMDNFIKCWHHIAKLYICAKKNAYDHRTILKPYALLYNNLSVNFTIMHQFPKIVLMSCLRWGDDKWSEIKLRCVNVCGGGISYISHWSYNLCSDRDISYWLQMVWINQSM